VFSSIAIIIGLYVLSSWAAVAGYADMKGAVTGVNFLGSFAEATPFLDLFRHFSPWFDWFIALVGFTSSFGCFLAAANSQTRITFNGARAGLLPPRMAAVLRTKVPLGAGVHLHRAACRPGRGAVLRGRGRGRPPYDHAEITSVAAAHVCFELLALMLLGKR
jgi:L-asparagine transporter-like permease